MSLRKENQVVVLLGAGASFKAGIPVSVGMINELEQLLEEDKKWKKYQDLYHFVKSAIYFADGIGGKFNNNVNYNIERLVNTLSELDRKTDHPLYPFIGNWNIKLTELGGADFTRVKELRQLILKQLQSVWVLPTNYNKSNYYRGLYDFANDYQHPLRVFSLNYDLCVERNAKPLEKVERGFGDSIENLTDIERTWDWKNFDFSDAPEPDIFLYKLHGSIDWFRNENKSLSFSDEAANIPTELLEIIFGTDYKLQYTDPFLYFVYQFRQWTLEAKLIIVIGYGFGDEHINGILGQALNVAGDSEERKLLAVAPFDNIPEEQAQQQLASILNGKKEQIIIKKLTAEKFMLEEMNINQLNALFSESEDAFDELS